ncbi:hypothetical protein WA556_006213, partial [Blastocystis sp. ATCC 50177/Nand II]
MNRSTSTRKTLGAKRSSTLSQRSAGLSRKSTLQSSLSLSESEIPRSGMVTPAVSVKEESSKVAESSIPVKASVSVESSKNEEVVESSRVEESVESSGVAEAVESSKAEESANPSNTEKPVKPSKTEKPLKPSKTQKTQKTQKRSTPTKQSTTEEDIPTPKRPKCKAPLRICASMLTPEDRDLLVSLVTAFPNCSLLRRSSREVGDVVVAGRSARSVKVLCAVAQGVCVVKREWLYASLEKGEWADIAKFIDPIAADGLKRRQEKKCGVFKDCGLIYVDKRTVPNRDELEMIIESGDGKVTRDPSNASICVIHPGSKALNNMCVHEDFVIEGAISCQLPPIEADPSSIKESLVEAESEE